jgi:hypothetical protein
VTDTAAKAAKWDRIAAAWNTYWDQGAGAFDWDDDSRDLMTELLAETAPESPPRSSCSYCGDPIRRTTAEDGIDPGEYEWVHEDGNPICPIPAVASP